MSVRHSERLRLHHGEDIAFGPGKADLLEAIVATGSISSGAAKIGMSYRRAWLLVETMNRCFAEPLVSAARGGAQGGGATLTATGREVLDRYRAMQAEVRAVVDRHAAGLSALLRSGAAPAPRRRSDEA